MRDGRRHGATDLDGIRPLAPSEYQRETTLVIELPNLPNAEPSDLLGCGGKPWVAT